MNKKLDSFFKISERGSNIKTEIIAGLTTFFAMAYIVVTNPNQITSFSTLGELGTIWNAVYVLPVPVAITRSRRSCPLAMASTVLFIAIR